MSALAAQTLPRKDALGNGSSSHWVRDSKIRWDPRDPPVRSRISEQSKFESHLNSVLRYRFNPAKAGLLIFFFLIRYTHILTLEMRDTVLHN